MPEPPNLIVDFDNTFIVGESLDELLRHAVSDRDDRDVLLQRFGAITDAGMQGDLPFSESLRQRIELLDVTREDVSTVATSLRGRVTDSFRRNREFLAGYAERLFVVSGGFRDLIEPVVSDFGIPETHVRANSFTYDGAGRVNGIDADCPLTRDRGKVSVVTELALTGETWVVGDGYTDYEIRQAGLATRFYVFTECIERERVIPLADHVATSLDDIITHLTAR